jgi:hypothetical protein
MKKYKIKLEGGGAEVVIGKLTNEQFNFWDDEEKVEEIFEEFDGALKKYVLSQEDWEDEIPRTARFGGGHWSEPDDIFHEYKIFSTEASLTIEGIDEESEPFEELYNNDLHEFIESHGSKINISVNDINTLNPDGNHLYHAVRTESGIFFEVILELEDEIDLSKFEWNYIKIPVSDDDDTAIEDMVESLKYNGVTYENENPDSNWDEITHEDYDFWII